MIPSWGESVRLWLFLTAYFLGQIQVYLWGEGLVGGFFLGFKFHDSDDFALTCRISLQGGIFGAILVGE